MSCEVRKLRAGSCLGKAKLGLCRAAGRWLRISQRHLDDTESCREFWTRWKSTWPSRYMVWKMFCME